MLFDEQGHVAEVDLLNDVRSHLGRLQAASTVGAQVDGVAVGRAGESFRREQRPFVFGMSGLAAALAFRLSGRWWRRRWFDDVRRRRLGGSRGTLAGGGELLPETKDGSLQRLQLRALLFQLSALLLELRLQTPAVGTGLCCCFGHDRILFRLGQTDQRTRERLRFDFIPALVTYTRSLTASGGRSSGSRAKQRTCPWRIFSAYQGS